MPLFCIKKGKLHNLQNGNQENMEHKGEYKIQLYWTFTRILDPKKAITAHCVYLCQIEDSFQVGSNRDSWEIKKEHLLCSGSKILNIPSVTSVRPFRPFSLVQILQNGSMDRDTFFYIYLRLVLPHQISLVSKKFHNYFLKLEGQNFANAE
jgi:hypothetical protein